MNTTSILRHINAIRCLRLLRRSEPMSRSDLARELNLTRTTVGNAVKVLLDSGLVFEPLAATEPAPLAESGSRIGRPSVGLALNPAGAFFVGLDIATSSVTAVLVDLTMKVVAQFTAAIGPGVSDVGAVTDRLATLADRAMAAAGEGRDRVRGIGVSIPGLVGRDGRVAVVPYLQWRNVDLRSMLADRLGPDLDIRICNDAVALASAVCATAIGMESSDFLLVLMAEGIGCAIVRQARVFGGFNGYAGEIGQMTLGPTIGPPSQTFQALAGSSFLDSHISSDRPLAESVLSLARAEGGTPPFLRDLEGWAAHLAAGFMNAIWILDPERIVVGGLLAPLYPKVAARVDALLAQGMSGLRVPPVVLSAYGAEGAAVGAAAMIRERLFEIPDLAAPGTI